MDIDLTETINGLESEMIAAANDLKFEKAALLRDQIKELKRVFDGPPPAKEVKSQTVNYRKGKAKKRV